MLCQKKKSQSRHSKRRERKKIKKKKVQSRQPVTVGHVSAIGLVPPFETAEMGKKTKKKKPKMKVSHFGILFSKGVRLEIFFGNRVRKKKFTNNMIKPKSPKYPCFRICNVDIQIIG